MMIVHEDARFSLLSGTLPKIGRLQPAIRATKRRLLPKVDPSREQAEAICVPFLVCRVGLHKPGAAHLPDKAEH